MTRFLVLFAVVGVAFYGAGFARGELRPESPPGAHKARIVKRVYWYRQVWHDNQGTPIYVKCRVGNRTRCWIVRIG